MYLWKAFMFAAFLFLSACDKEQGNEFIGTWKQTSGSDKLEIKKNGDNFIVTNISYFYLSKENIEEFRNSMAAINKDGGLEVSGEFGRSLLVIEKKSGHLVGAGSEYKKIN